MEGSEFLRAQAEPDGDRGARSGEALGPGSRQRVLEELSYKSSILESVAVAGLLVGVLCSFQMPQKLLGTGRLINPVFYGKLIPKFNRWRPMAKTWRRVIRLRTNLNVKEIEAKQTLLLSATLSQVEELE